MRQRRFNSYLISPEIFLGGLVDKALHKAYPSLPAEEKATVVLANSAKTDAAYQCNTAFTLGKKLNTNPASIAERIVGIINQKEDSEQEHEARKALAEVNVSRGGFIAMHLRNEWLAERVKDARRLVNKNVNLFPFGTLFAPFAFPSSSPLPTNPNPLLPNIVCCHLCLSFMFLFLFANEGS